MAVLFLTADMMFLPALNAAGAAQGCEVQLAISPNHLLQKAAETKAELVILDLSTPRLEPVALVSELRGLAEPPAAIIAYGPHVHEGKLAAASEAGCDQVLTRGQFHAHMGAILKKYAGASGSSR